MKQLILGGARSGKSSLAERLALACGLPVSCIATARPGDAEMVERIRHHRAQRPRDWTLVEEPLELAEALTACWGHDRCVLVDCLTLWLTQILEDGVQSSVYTERREAFLSALATAPGHIILVSNETGMGTVPVHAFARQYGDEAGRLHQRVAGLCDRVILTVAGLPLVLKGDSL